MTIPAIILGFNRPKYLSKSLSAVTQSGIEKIYVHLDGPRKDRTQDIKLVGECQEVVASFKSRYVNILSNYSEINLGCGPGITSGLNWFFSQEEKGLIIEDDILITKTFVQFAEEALEIFKNDESIWQINGWSPFNKAFGCNSVYQTRFANPWGWATWRNRWEKQNYQKEFFSEISSINLPSNKGFETGPEFEEYWNRNFNYRNHRNSPEWDYQWVHRIWCNGGYAISPPFRMTTNIGFGKDSTHTFRPIRNQLPKFEINKSWNMNPCANSPAKDRVLRIAVFPESCSREESKKLFREKFAIQRIYTKNRFISLIRIIEYRAIFSKYLSLFAIKITLRSIIRKLIFIKRVKNAIHR